MQIQKQGVPLEALAIALINPELSGDPRILCAAACTCKAWREAVQQCGACNTAVEVSLSAPLSRLCSFAAWLPQHAALVNSITFSKPRREIQTVDGLQWELHLNTAQHLLQQAMQLAQALPAAAAAGAGQDTASATQQHHLQRQACSRLPDISSVTFVGNTGMLAALPAASLTHLNLKELQGPVHAPAVSAALARLSKLQQLRVGVSRRLAGWVSRVLAGDAQADLPYGCLAGVAQLSRLTSLEVGGSCSGSTQQLQQLLMQPLPLRVLRLDPWITSPLDLSQLTRLEELYNPCTLPGVVFPPQLQRLKVRLPFGDAAVGERLLQAVMQLQQLQRLAIGGIGAALPLLQRLSELVALRQLSLGYADGNVAAAAAPGWLRLPLCELIIHHLSQLSTQDWEATISAVAACTNLTKLELAGECHHGEGQGQGQIVIPLFVKLAGLPNLRHLCCYGCSLAAPAEASALTALTGLTHLELHGCRAGVGDGAAAAIAGSCRQLRHLGLNSCNLVSMACLADVRQLTQLTELRLGRNQGLTQQGLMLLTRLKGLQVLDLDVSADVTDEAVENFWAATKNMGPPQLKELLSSHSYGGSKVVVFRWGADA